MSESALSCAASTTIVASVGTKSLIVTVVRCGVAADSSTATSVAA